MKTIITFLFCLVSILNMEVVGQTFRDRLNNVTETQQDEEISSRGKLDSIFPFSGKHRGYSYVDLGLPSGNLWATCNVGSSYDNVCGNVYAWGEVKTKSVFNQNNCSTLGIEASNFRCWDENFDVVKARWGGDWESPESYDYQELIKNCNTQWLTSSKNGESRIIGVKLIGPNENFIVFPISTSFNSYWGSDPYDDNGWGWNKWDAMAFGIDQSKCYTFTDERWKGKYIRGIIKKRRKLK